MIPVKYYIVHTGKVGGLLLPEREKCIYHIIMQKVYCNNLNILLQTFHIITGRVFLFLVWQ